MSNIPSDKLLTKYKNAMIKAMVNELYGGDYIKKNGKDEYDKGVAIVKNDILKRKYNDKGLVFFVAKNYPNDKIYQELKSNKKSTADIKKDVETKFSKVGNKVTSFLKNKDNQKKLIQAGQTGLASYVLYKASKTLVGRSFLDDAKKGIIFYIPISKKVLGELFNDRYEIQKVLGAGNFGSVTLSKDKLTGKLVVIKGIKIQFDNPLQELLVQDELTILKLFKNNCKYISCYIDDKVDDQVTILKYGKSIDKTIYIVQSYDYPDTLSNVYLNLSDEIINKIIENLIKGLQVLHNNYVAHNDIKLENIIVNINTGDIKYIDFGTSCYKTCKLISAGTYVYSSPEFKERAEKVSRNEQQSVIPFESAKSNDIWSIGVLIFILKNKIKNSNLLNITTESNMVNTITSDTNEKNKDINKILLEIFVKEKDRIKLDKLLSKFKITISKPSGNFFSYFF